MLLCYDILCSVCVHVVCVVLTNFVYLQSISSGSEEQVALLGESDLACIP